MSFRGFSRFLCLEQEKEFAALPLAHTLLFLPSLLPLPGSRLSGKGAPHRFGRVEQRDRGEPACVPLKSTKPTRCGVGIFKIRGKRQAMTCVSTRSGVASVRRFTWPQALLCGGGGLCVKLSSGISLRIQKVVKSSVLAPRHALRSLDREATAGLTLAKLCPI